MVALFKNTGYSNNMPKLNQTENSLKKEKPELLAYIWSQIGAAIWHSSIPFKSNAVLSKGLELQFVENESLHMP